MPFNASLCPTGWIPADGASGISDARGRFVIGVGNLPFGNSISLKAYGGSHMWRRWSHGGFGGRWSNQYGCTELSVVGFGWQGETDQTMGQGGWGSWSSYYHHLPPYTGLLFCVKQ